MARERFETLSQTQPQTLAQERAAAFLRRVYWWMTVGLGVTGAAAWVVVVSPGMQRFIFGNPIVFFGLIIVQLVLVFSLSARAERMTVQGAVGTFLIYSLLMGLTLSSIFLVYTANSITQVFFITAGTFAGTSLWAYTTKRNLASWGSFFMMGLIGIIIASVVNLFLQSPALYWAISYIGVFVFVGLTAYDTQRLTLMGAQGFGDEAAATKASVVGALILYLDFVNLFLLLLRIFGRRS
ncbi:MAG: Bax inhibitor-1 family protein [Nitrospinota bacterium]